METEPQIDDMDVAPPQNVPVPANLVGSESPDADGEAVKKKAKSKKRGSSRSRANMAYFGGDDESDDGEKPKKGKTQNVPIINHDNCDACNDGGELLCCDGCPRSFHFECLDPPVSPDDIGDDEKWYCNDCKKNLSLCDAPKVPQSSTMKALFNFVPTQNPTVFSLPDALRKITHDSMRAQEVQKYDVSYLMRNPDNVRLRYATIPREATRGAQMNLPVCSVCAVDSQDLMVHCIYPDCNVGLHSYCSDTPVDARTWVCPDHNAEKNVASNVTPVSFPVDLPPVTRPSSLRSSRNRNDNSHSGDANQPVSSPQESEKKEARKSKGLTKEQEVARDLEAKHMQYKDMSRLRYEQNLRRFRFLSAEDQDKQIAQVEDEVKRLYHEAMGMNSMNPDVAVPTIVGPQVMNQLGTLFTQFLAWQRLMQLVDVVPTKETVGESSKVHEEPKTKKRKRENEDEVKKTEEKPQNEKQTELKEKEDMSMPPPAKKARVEETPAAPAVPRLNLPPANNTSNNHQEKEVNENEKPGERIDAMEVDEKKDEGNDDDDNENHRGQGDDQENDDLEEEPVLPTPREDDNGNEVPAGQDNNEEPPQTPRGQLPDRINPATPETPAAVSETPTKYTPGKFSLKPATVLPRAAISGDGLWGEHFYFELNQYPTGFLIGRKNPNVDLDMSEYTDVRTVSHRHCMFVFNRKLNQFQIENYGRNGTRVNNELFGKSGNARRTLVHGDVIEVGKVAIKFELLPVQEGETVKKEEAAKKA